MNRFWKVLPLLLAFLIALPLTAADGASAYKSKCAACHGQDGSGATAMGKKLNIRSFAEPEVQKQTDAELLEVTKKGKGKMPGYDGKLTNDELKAVVAHIRTFAKK